MTQTVELMDSIADNYAGYNRTWKKWAGLTDEFHKHAMRCI
jgi:hypothetical protein